MVLTAYVRYVIVYVRKMISENIFFVQSVKRNKDEGRREM